MKPITQEAWQPVLEIACDIANAAMADDDVLFEEEIMIIRESIRELDASL